MSAVQILCPRSKDRDVGKRQLANDFIKKSSAAKERLHDRDPEIRSIQGKHESGESCPAADIAHVNISGDGLTQERTVQQMAFPQP